MLKARCPLWVKSGHGRISDVRFTSKSGHRSAGQQCPLCAKSGLMHCSNLGPETHPAALPQSLPFLFFTLAYRVMRSRYRDELSDKGRRLASISPQIARRQIMLRKTLVTLVSVAALGLGSAAMAAKGGGGGGGGIGDGGGSMMMRSGPAPTMMNGGGGMG